MRTGMSHRELMSLHLLSCDQPMAMQARLRQGLAQTPFCRPARVPRPSAPTSYMVPVSATCDADAMQWVAQHVLHFRPGGNMLPTQAGSLQVSLPWPEAERATLQAAGHCCQERCQGHCRGCRWQHHTCSQVRTGRGPAQTLAFQPPGRHLWCDCRKGSVFARLKATSGSALPMPAGEYSPPTSRACACTRCAKPGQS